MNLVESGGSKRGPLLVIEHTRPGQIKYDDLAKAGNVRSTALIGAWELGGRY